MKIYHCFYFLYFSMTQKPILAQNSVPGITCDVNNDETLSFSKIICSFMCRRQSCLMKMNMLEFLGHFPDNLLRGTVNPITEK